MTQKSEMQWRNVLEIHSKIYCQERNESQKKLTTSFFNFWKRNSYAIEVENLLEVNSINVYAELLHFCKDVAIQWWGIFDLDEWLLSNRGRYLFLAILPVVDLLNNTKVMSYHEFWIILMYHLHSRLTNCHLEAVPNNWECP